MKKPLTKKKSTRVSAKQKLCIECQKCCTNVAVYTHPDFYECDPKEVRNFYKLRGFHVCKDNGALLLTVPYPCPNLTAEGCKIYDKRPQTCRDYDGLEDFGDECLWSGLKKKKK